MKSSFLVCALVAAMLIPVAGLARPSVMVSDVSTGAVLVADDADARRHPASLTKLMTLFLLFEAIEDRRVTLDQKLVVSNQAAHQPPTKMGLRPGARISVEECIQALIVRSANDVAVVVAEGIAGSEPAFAEKMTATARRLGMNQTEFRNASGLPDPGQLTTARDLTVLAKTLMSRFPQHYHYFDTRTCRVAGRTITTHNRFLQLYDGADGLKTGYTREAGYNLAASVVRDGHRLIGVVLGGRSRRARDTEMTRVMNAGFTALGTTAGPKVRFENAGLRKSMKPKTVQVRAAKHHPRRGHALRAAQRSHRRARA